MARYTADQEYKMNRCDPYADYNGDEPPTRENKMSTTFYFVKDGLLNGEPGVYATTIGVGEQQKDGWYYLPDGAENGYGPYPNEESAILASVDPVEE